MPKDYHFAIGNRPAPRVGSMRLMVAFSIEVHSGAGRIGLALNAPCCLHERQSRWAHCAPYAIGP
jgi:hypothetical protein